LKNALVFASIALSTIFIRQNFPALVQSALESYHAPGGAEYLLPVASGAILIHLLAGKSWRLLLRY